MLSIIILASISVCLFLLVRIIYGGVWGLLTKMLASFMFIAVGFVAIIVNQNDIFISILVLLGLLCGLIGDVLLDLKVVYKENNDIYLNSGMTAFFLGHLFYFVAMIAYTNGTINLLFPIITSLAVAAIFVPAIILGGRKFMHLNFGKFIWQTAIYTFILIFLSVFCLYLTIIDIKFLLFAIGVILIFASDFVLSFNYFKEGNENKAILVLLNHLIYYAGQIVMASALFFLI